MDFPWLMGVNVQLPIGKHGRSAQLFHPCKGP